jgi:CRISPR-associated protein Csm5
MTLGAPGADPMRLLTMSDSTPIPASAFKVYLVRVSTLNQNPKGAFELGWKQAQRPGSAGPKPENGTPMFAEMAVPGTVFAGSWSEREFLKQPDVAKALHRRESFSTDRIVKAANAYAAAMLAAQKRYAESAGLAKVGEAITQLEGQLAGLSGNSCLVNLGWGGGFLGKAAYLDTADEEYRQVLKTLPFYSRAIRSGLPFPKTRRIVFLGNQPGTLPGWSVLEL